MDRYTDQPGIAMLLHGMFCGGGETGDAIDPDCGLPGTIDVHFS